MRILLATLMVALFSACADANNELKERVTYWQNALAQAAPIGSRKEKIIEWGLNHNVQFMYLEQQHWLYVNVEKIPESGIPFPCSHWNIILKITIDDNGHSTKNEVNTVGICL